MDAPFASLAREGRLIGRPYDGYWISLDTLKEVEALQRLEAQDAAPWAVWRRSAEVPDAG